MSFDKIKPQSFEPITLKTDQVQQFFNDLRDRKLVQGDLPSFKITTKPFESEQPKQIHSGLVDEGEKRKRKLESDNATNHITQKKKNRGRQEGEA